MENKDVRFYFEFYDNVRQALVQYICGYWSAFCVSQGFLNEQGEPYEPLVFSNYKTKVDKSNGIVFELYFHGPDHWEVSQTQLSIVKFNINFNDLPLPIRVKLQKAVEMTKAEFV